MQELYKSIGRIAPQDVTVLILGESGTGKEMVARAIYQHSRRSRAPLLAINCAAIPEPLLESELFGHERGAFTGADRRRIGKFEQADGGTIFMDEVGDMAPATQAKLLRLLQDGQFERVGGNATIHTNVRLIAATNQDLESLAAAGRFRQDLFYRLNVLTIRIPPLRERIDDIPLLVNYFLGRMNREFDRRVCGISPEAMQLLKQHHWPGNVRELQSAVKHALIHTPGDILSPDCFPAPLAREFPASPAAAGGSGRRSRSRPPGSRAARTKPRQHLPSRAGGRRSGRAQRRARPRQGEPGGSGGTARHLPQHAAIQTPQPEDWSSRSRSAIRRTTDRHPLPWLIQAHETRLSGGVFRQVPAGFPGLG